MDYSRFDNIDSDVSLDSDDEREKSKRTGSVKNSTSMKPPASEGSRDASSSSAPAAQSAPPIVKGKLSLGSSGRFKFEYGGQTVYEWEQSLEDVSVRALYLGVK
jgi:hypothetical protein